MEGITEEDLEKILTFTSNKARQENKGPVLLSLSLQTIVENYKGLLCR